MKTGDRVVAKHFNFDGRHTDPEAGIWPPDEDNPDEDLEGFLIVQPKSTAWGDRTDYLIKLDDGAVRYIEEDTIKPVGGTGGS